MDLREEHTMNNKCRGCGIILQNDQIEEIGYTQELDKELCGRCFRIRHYSDYKKVEKSGDEYLSILKGINDTKELVILVVDLFLLNQGIFTIEKYIQNPVLLVLTKRDVLPLSVNDEKLKDYMESSNLTIVDMEVISSTKNYNFDSLYDKIMKHKKSKNVYVAGFTNAGKSTMINKLIYHYSDLEMDITTSIMPSTTLDSIVVELSADLTLIDTPGLLVQNSFMNEVDGKTLKKIMPKKEIRPITYQIKTEQYIVIEDLVKMTVTPKTNVTIYMSGALAVDRLYRDNGITYPYIKEINAYDGDDIVIEGLGFIKCTKRTKIKIETACDVHVYKRNSLIG